MILKILNFCKKKLSSGEKFKTPFFTKDIFENEKYKIGDYTYGHPSILFKNGGANLYIGKFCSIAKGVTIFLGGNHRTDWVSTYPFNDLLDYFPEAKDIEGHPATKGDVVIKNDVWIGNGATILSGVSIGDGAVIGAGSVVSKNVGEYEIWAGNPAKLIKKRFNDDKIEELREMKWWDWKIDRVKSELNYLCNKPK